MPTRRASTKPREPKGAAAAAATKAAPVDLTVVVDREIDGPGRPVDVAVPSRMPAADAVAASGDDAVAPAAQTGAPVAEVVEPFVRAIEALLRALGDAVGEHSASATLSMGSLVIDFDSPGLGDDTVRVRSAGQAPRPARISTGGADQTPPAPGFQREGDTWERAVAAAREGDHVQALADFEKEAEDAVAHGVHQRAAIAYRSASREADLLGRQDYGNKLLRLAGKHYLFVAESPTTTSHGVVQAFVAAAKCFLQAGNLPLANASITRALATNETLSEIA